MGSQKDIQELIHINLTYTEKHRIIVMRSILNQLLGTCTREIGEDGKTYTLDVKQTSYLVLTNSSNIGPVSKILPARTTYWLASRCENLKNDYVSFEMGALSNYIGGVAEMYRSNNVECSVFSYAFRPVVTLPDVNKVIPCIGDNSPNNPHEINW